MPVIRPTPLTRRPGAIAPLTAISLIFLLGMAAFAVDMGWIVLIKSDLQSAADASALAGANALTNRFVEFNLAGVSNTTAGTTNAKQNTIIAQAKTDATAAAKNYASLNG